jgi:hypothetical protein
MGEITITERLSDCFACPAAVIDGILYITGPSGEVARDPLGSGFAQPLSFSALTRDNSRRQF